MGVAWCKVVVRTNNRVRNSKIDMQDDAAIYLVNASQYRIYEYLGKASLKEIICLLFNGLRMMLEESMPCKLSLLHENALIQRTR